MVYALLLNPHHCSVCSLLSLCNPVATLSLAAGDCCESSYISLLVTLVSGRTQAWLSSMAWSAPRGRHPVAPRLPRSRRKSWQTGMRAAPALQRRSRRVRAPAA